MPGHRLLKTAEAVGEYIQQERATRGTPQKLMTLSDRICP
jgi:hypothetical protein